MEKSRSLSIAVRGLFVSAFFAVIFNTVSVSAITVTYKSYGGLFDDRSDTNVVEYNDDKTVADGSAYKEPTNLYACSDSKIFTGWFTDKGMKQQFYLRDATEDTTVYAGYTKYAACFTGTTFGEPYIIRPNKTYNFQLWGSISGSNHTGNGGYVAGDLLLNQERQLYVYTGNNKAYSATHTFNGGGKGEWGAIGGGATDVRLVGGEWDAEGSLESRIMVAGGGGGKYNKGAVTVDIVSENQSYAGGLRSYNTNETPTDLTAYGATQTSGGTTPHRWDDPYAYFIHDYSGHFGKGGYSYNSNNATLLGRSAGGGGGYYGGAQSGRYAADTFISGTGGSSFISGHTGSVAITSATDLTPRKDSQDNQCADGTIDSLCSIHYSGISFTNTVMIDGAGYQWTTEKGNQPVGMPNIYNSSTEMGHKGSGYAKVTTNEETFHTVTFKHADEDEFTVYVIDGEKVVRPNIYIQEKDGYRIHKWEIEGTDNEWNFNDGITGDLVLVAYQDIVTYDISYNLGTGTLSEANPATYTVETEDITLNNPTAPNHYDFLGWSGTDLTGDRNLTVTIPKGSIGNREYTANIAPTPYTITYSLDGGTNGANNPTEYNYESSEIVLARPTKEGYTFTGWSGTDIDGEDNLDVAIPAQSHGDREYTAHWSINRYTATFDANAGETANPETITKNYDEELGNLPETSRLGYKFLGWFTDATAGDEITEATKMPADNVTYYAHWEIITYTIEYDLGGEDMDAAPSNDSSNPANYTVEDADITLKAATPGDTWHYFVGWALDRDTEDGLTDNFVINTSEAKNIKVYAIFQANPYTVTLDPENGDEKTIKTVRGDQEIGELPTPERAGYEFLGWFVGDKQIDEHFHPRSDSIAVARWAEIPTVPNTGDAIMNHIVTFAVCAFALFIVVALRKRKSKNEA